MPENHLMRMLTVSKLAVTLALSSARFILVSVDIGYHTFEVVAHFLLMLVSRSDYNRWLLMLCYVNMLCSMLTSCPLWLPFFLFFYRQGRSRTWVWSLPANFHLYPWHPALFIAYLGVVMSVWLILAYRLFSLMSVNVNMVGVNT